METKKTKKTKKYKYLYYGTPIPKANFLKSVPENWQEEVDEYGCYSYGGYQAVERDEE